MTHGALPLVQIHNTMNPMRSVEGIVLLPKWGEEFGITLSISCRKKEKKLSDLVIEFAAVLMICLIIRDEPTHSDPPSVLLSPRPYADLDAKHKSRHIRLYRMNIHDARDDRLNTYERTDEEFVISRKSDAEAVKVRDRRVKRDANLGRGVPLREQIGMGGEDCRMCARLNLGFRVVKLPDLSSQEVERRYISRYLFTKWLVRWNCPPT